MGHFQGTKIRTGIRKPVSDDAGEDRPYNNIDITCMFSNIFIGYKCDNASVK